MTSLSVPVRFAGQIPAPDAIPSRSPKAAEVLAKVDAGTMSVDEASELRLKDIKALVFGVSAERLQRDPTAATARDFLFMAKAANDALPTAVASAHAKGWSTLDRAAGSEGDLEARFWDASLIGQLVSALPTVPKQHLDAVSNLVFGIATKAGEMPLDNRGYTITDRVVGDFLDRKWELLEKKTTEAFRADIERAIEVAPRSSMWLRSNEKDGPHMTRANYDRAGELLAADPRSSMQSKFLLERAPMDWISFDESLQRVREKPIRIADLINFRGATVEHTRIVLDRILARDFDRYDKNIGFDRIPELPHLKRLLSDGKWMDDLCGKPLGDSTWLVRTLAEEHPDPTAGHALLLSAARATVADGQKRESAGDESRVTIALGVVMELVGSKKDLRAEASAALSVKDVSQLIVQSGVKGDERDWRWRDAVERTVKDQELSKLERDVLLDAMVQTKMISIGSLPKSDQRLGVVGNAIRNEPERLAEVTDLEIFKRLARQLDIPVEVPSVDAARERRDQALAVISESSPQKAARPR